MEADALHDLTAAYALNALDAEDAGRYEAHLARCQRCQSELAELSESASALAYAADAPRPSPELRSRILEQARSERPNVVPLRPRWLRPVIAAAAVAACAAIGLGLWASSLSGKLDRTEADLARQQRVAQILAQPGSHKIAFSRGTLVVGADGKGALLLNQLAEPGSGRTYEAWVADGGAPQPAGLFSGGTTVAVPLDQPVRAGATVLVTEEKAGGTEAPSRAPFLIVRNTAQS
ncbi:MAG: anti-sigma factor [Actinobacteria bacterium]|nr:MAG: anti-sigma factor [Actinomycetota bacterium]TML80582.1 MAG: anti-sigma factor [Actinomycetota bacterium]